MRPIIESFTPTTRPISDHYVVEPANPYVRWLAQEEGRMGMYGGVEPHSSAARTLRFCGDFVLQLLEGIQNPDEFFAEGVTAYSTRGGLSLYVVRAMIPNAMFRRRHSFSTLVVSPSTLRTISPGRLIPFANSR